MKENKYNHSGFFCRYSQMSRSVNGLDGAAEWHILRKMLPDFNDKRVLDLGCGFGWHCQYAAGNGARSVFGIDISEKMITEAIRKNAFENVHYECMAIEDFGFPNQSYDIVLSSLAFHYMESFSDLCRDVNNCLVPGGVFVFSVEHPVFTAYGNQEWILNDKGERLHWPVDHYFDQGKRTANFLDTSVTKYHKTLTTYVNGLLQNGFEITGLNEPEPEARFLQSVPEMKDELRRPMFLMISALKK